MLLLLNQILRSVFQPVITLKKQKCHNNTSLKKNDLNHSRAVPKGSNLRTSWTIVRRQSTGWVLTITNKCVTSPLHSGSLTGGRRLIREINQAMFSNLGPKPEVKHFARQDSGLYQIFKLIVSTSERILNNMNVQV